MLARPPRQPEIVSWVWALGCAVAIFCTIPLARDIQTRVDATVGRAAFTYGVLTVGAVAAVAAVAAVVRARLPWPAYLWLAASAGVFGWYTFALDASPEESVHFVEYGALAVLLFRALSHRFSDLTIYGSTLALGACVGILDETIQWVMPRRVWDLRDIGLNFMGVSMVVVPIALGIRPAFVKWTATPRGLRFMVRAMGAAVVLLGLCLLNTPERIEWYATRVPGLSFLVDNQSMMVEYGHLYEDPEIGVFRSRFDPETLARLDRERAEEAAAILDDYHHGSRYGDFLKVYTPMKDPFLHEARVHLFRRDHYHYWGFEKPKDDPERAEHLAIVVRENQIVEKYFPETLKRSKFLLEPEQIAAAKAEAMLDGTYESPVSQGLFTAVSEQTIVIGLLVVLGLLFAVDRRSLRTAATSAAALLLLVRCASPGPTAPGGAPEPFTIVFYTDVHARTEYETPAALELAARRINGEKADLVIAGGDVITDGFQSTADVVGPRWDAYLKMVTKIDGGVRHVIGNHDLVAADPDDGSPPAADPRAMWRAKVGEKQSYQSFDAGGYHFVFLDSIEVGGELRYRGRVSDEQLAWLEGDLAKVKPGTPIVAATHIPLLTTFYAATQGSTTSAPANRVVVNNREVLERFSGHDLVLVLQGHGHASEAIVWRGVTFLTGGALSAKWWRGPWHGTEEGYTVVELVGREVRWRYVDLGWDAKRPPKG